MNVQKLKALSLVWVGLALAGCGEDVSVMASDPELPVAEIPFEQARADAGELAYASQCAGCHKSEGLAREGNITPILYSHYGTFEAVEEGRLAERIERTMPEGNAGACDQECALDIQDYFYRLWTQEADPTDDTPVSQAESDARVAAGLALYQSNNCALCHGDDGTQEGFDVIVDSDRTYDEVRAIIQVGAPDAVVAMPACNPEGNCADQLADYVWVEFLGWTLTDGGGVKVPQ